MLGGLSRAKLRRYNPRLWRNVRESCRPFPHSAKMLSPTSQCVPQRYIMQTSNTCSCTDLSLPQKTPCSLLIQKPFRRQTLRRIWNSTAPSEFYLVPKDKFTSILQMGEPSELIWFLSLTSLFNDLRKGEHRWRSGISSRCILFQGQ